MQFHQTDIEPYQFESPENGVYAFTTIEKAEYAVVFKPSPYVLGDEADFAEYIVELVIIASYLPDAKTKTDIRIAATIAAIVQHYYLQSNNWVCIYICDSSDGRQHARERKFKQWFEFFNDADFIRVSETITDAEGIVYPVALILKFKNPYRNKILDAFEELTNTYSKH